MKRYRRLEVGDTVEVTNIEAKTVYISELVHNGMTGKVIAGQCGKDSVGLIFEFADKSVPLYQCIPLACLNIELKPITKLTRKYRLIKDNEPIQMFDWFKLKVHREFGLWPAPDKQYNEGWCQIEPGVNDHWLDVLNPSNRSEFIFARFVDCVPVKKS